MITARTIRLTSVALVFVAFAAVPRLATATSCASSGGSIATDVARAAAIVLGRVTHVALPATEVHDEAGQITVHGSTGDPRRIDLVIEETFKGSIAGRVQIEATFTFIAGARYLIYFPEAASRLVLGPCARIHEVSTAGDDLLYLEGMRKGMMPAVLYGQVLLRSPLDRVLPDGDATVVASSPANPRQEVKAGKYGGYTIVLRPGGYSFWVERAGRQVTNAERIEVVAGDQMKNVEVAASPGEMARDRSITARTIGPIALGMTLDEARQEAPAAEFRRTSDGDGAALVEIMLEPNASMLVRTDEDNPAAPIDWTGRIQSIETFDSAFSVVGLIAPGTSVYTATHIWGPVQDIVVSEIEARQFIRFERQPNGMTLRLDGTGQFPKGVSHTRRYQSDGKILSIAISIQ